MESFSHLVKFSKCQKSDVTAERRWEPDRGSNKLHRNGTYGSDCSANRKRSIRKKAGKLAMKEGEVYYEKKPGQWVRYVRSETEKLRIVRCCHADPTSGHLGEKKTYNRIIERFTWKGVMKDVKQVVSACDECQRTRDKLTTTRPELHPIPVHSPWYHIGIDFIGPLSPVSQSGNRYILTISDYFTKWVTAAALPTKEAVGVAYELLKVFMTMGLPRIITSDQGREFRNVLNGELMRKLNIKHHLTTPYHPQANGLDERFNQTLQRMLIKFCHNNKNTWDEYLNSCIFAYNTSRHESSLYSPFEVMFGRKPVLPIDINEKQTKADIPDLDKQCNMEEVVSKLTVERLCVFKKVKENICKAQSKQKRLYDQKHAIPIAFEVGANVLMKDFRRKKRKGGKLDYKWKGPYEITDCLGKGFYKLKLSSQDNVIVKRVNGAHLRLYKMPVEGSSSSLSNSIPSNPSHSSSTCSLQLTPINSNSSPYSPQTPPINLSLYPPYSPQLSPNCSSSPPYLPQHTSNLSSFSVSTIPIPNTFADLELVCSTPNKCRGNNTLPINPLTPIKEAHIEDEKMSSFPKKKDKRIPLILVNKGKENTIGTSQQTNKQDGKGRHDKRSLSFAAMKDAKRRKRQQCTWMKKAINSEECVDLTNKEDVPTIYWIQELTLFPSDKNSLINGSWLSDALITAGQKLLKDAYPHIGGLQPTILGMTLAFEVQRKQFVQVLHINENHWVTASNIGCPVATVDIFDSMRCTRLSFRAKAQIAAMLFTDQPEITVRFQPVQLQHGTSDCGVFSLAFATSLCGGQTPTQITYIQHQLRDHLCHCPENKTITPFPCQQQRKKAKQYVADMKFRVYCKCRQPEEGRMIECEDCKEWYHEDCVEVPSVIWQTNSHISWICDSCIKTLN